MKKKLVAASFGLALSAAVSCPVFAAGWQQEADGRYWYENEDGTYAKGMKQIDGKTYIFDENGYMKTGWDYYNWNYYYMDASGAIQVGWVSINGTWYYMDGEGVMQRGFLMLGHDIYYLDTSTGAMVTGMFEFEGYRYQAGEDGKLIRSKKDGNVRYDSDGRISYYNSNTHEWDYMPDSSDTAEIVKKGLASKYEDGRYYSNKKFEAEAYQNLKSYLSNEEIEEFIDEVEYANEDIYQRNEDRDDR